jgi:hypothetical protein
MFSFIAASFEMGLLYEREAAMVCRPKGRKPQGAGPVHWRLAGDRDRKDRAGRDVEAGGSLPSRPFSTPMA